MNDSKSKDVHAKEARGLIEFLGRKKALCQEVIEALEVAEHQTVMLAEERRARSDSEKAISTLEAECNQLKDRVLELRNRFAPADLLHTESGRKPVDFKDLSHDQADAITAFRRVFEPDGLSGKVQWFCDGRMRGGLFDRPLEFAKTEEGADRQWQGTLCIADGVVIIFYGSSPIDAFEQLRSVIPNSKLMQ